MEKIFSVKDVQEIDCSQTWTTKANATLRVLTKTSYACLHFFPAPGFFHYDQKELKKTGDIRGLRTYTVRGQNPEKEGKPLIGGTEFHRIRWEYIIGLEGKFKWTSEDLHGEKKVSIISPSTGILLPPFILHKNEALEENSGLLVICNTLFDPNDEKTKDTYPEEKFEELKKRLLN